MFIHNISLKHNRETTASNLFQASLLRSVVGEFHFSLWKPEKCALLKTDKTYYSW